MRQLLLAFPVLAGCIIVPPRASGPTEPHAAPAGEGVPASGGYHQSSPAPAPAAPAVRPPPPPPPSAPSTRSVTIRSACPRTVRVFYGDKPKFGSGTYSTISSNSVSSKTFRVGDMMWIVDGGDNEVAAAGVGATTGSIEILASCTSLIAR